MIRRGILLVILLPLLGACSVYHPLKDGVGYSELPVGNNGFQVSYVGTNSANEARQYCLTRASELTVLNNAAFFQIVDERIYISYGTHYWPGSYDSYVSGYRRGGAPIIYQRYEPGYTEVYSLPEVNMTIHLCQPGDPNAIPAAYLLHQAIENKIELSPGIEERLAALPESPPTFALPPPPPPTTRPFP